MAKASSKEERDAGAVEWGGDLEGEDVTTGAKDRKNIVGSPVSHIWGSNLATWWLMRRRRRWRSWCHNKRWRGRWEVQCAMTSCRRSCSWSYDTWSYDITKSLEDLTPTAIIPTEGEDNEWLPAIQKLRKTVFPRWVWLHQLERGLEAQNLHLPSKAIEPHSQAST